MSAESTVWIVSRLCKGCCSDPIMQVCPSREIADEVIARLSELYPLVKFYSDEFKVEDEIPLE